MNHPAIDYRALPVSERIELVEAIWDSIAEDTQASLDLSPEQRAELDRRLAAHCADPTSSIPWEQVRERLFKGRP
ncbi:MAG: addiction module protein [Rudaea sp.]